MNAATDFSHEVGKQPACEALGMSRATFYRHSGKSLLRPRERTIVLPLRWP